MAKYLWEIKLGADAEVHKYQYTIVYENNSYIYCKVNGSDELKRVNTGVLDRGEISRYSSFYTKDESKINGNFLKLQSSKQTLLRLKNSVSNAERQLTSYERSIENNKEKILHEKRVIVELEKIIEELESDYSVELK